MCLVVCIQEHSLTVWKQEHPGFTQGWGSIGWAGWRVKGGEEVNITECLHRVYKNRHSYIHCLIHKDHYIGYDAFGCSQEKNSTNNGLKVFVVYLGVCRKLDLGLVWKLHNILRDLGFPFPFVPSLSKLGFICRLGPHVWTVVVPAHKAEFPHMTALSVGREKITS